MKRNMILKAMSYALFMAFLCMFYTANAQVTKANFTGNWVFNAEKSNMGQPPQGQPPQGQGQRMGGPGGGDFVAKQETNLMTVERTRTNQEGQSTTITSKYTLDGKECVNTTPRGDSKSTVAWSADGKTLTISTTRIFERDGQSMEIKSSEVWALTDPTTLSIATTMNTPNGERKTTMVYTRK